jgi:hypothetical protein
VFEQGNEANFVQKERKGAVGDGWVIFRFSSKLMYSRSPRYFQSPPAQKRETLEKAAIKSKKTLMIASWRWIIYKWSIHIFTQRFLSTF